MNATHERAALTHFGRARWWIGEARAEITSAGHLSCLRHAREDATLALDLLTNEIDRLTEDQEHNDFKNAEPTAAEQDYFDRNEETIRDHAASYKDSSE